MSQTDNNEVKAKLESYLQYAQNLEDKILLLLKEAKLNEDSLVATDEDDYMFCPFDSSHRIYKKRYKDHMWHVHHYNTDMDVNDNIDFFYENAPNLKHIHIVPEMAPKVELPTKQLQEEVVDYESLPIVNAMLMVPLDFYSRMDPSDMESAVNAMMQIPATFLNVQLPLISISRLDVQISTLFSKLGVLQDQDLVNIVIGMLLNTSTMHPDIMVTELTPFLGSQTRTFVLGLWKYLAKVEIRRIRNELLRLGDPTVVTRRVAAPSEIAPLSKWEMESLNTDLTKEDTKTPATLPGGDYKRRRQSYRAKMTHLTKRTTIQEHRDFINSRMQMLAEDKGYRLIGTIDRVTTKTTPLEIEKEMRKKRVTPKELQFKNPLDARNNVRRKLHERRHHR